jgi:glutamate dehydrogenase/leucine dehydrogenase
VDRVRRPLPTRGTDAVADVLEDLIRSWDGEEVAIHYDHAGEAWMFVCIHSTKRGPAGGGTRMKVYPTPADGLADAMRLSEGMTMKMAATDIPFGGAKAVIVVPELPEGHERRRLLLRYGDLAASLGGSFQTGPDMNTTIADMDVIAERHEHVYCRSVENGGSGDPGPYTARGVFHGIRASTAHAFGSPELAGRSILVQGVGDVGARLAEQLAEAGAQVLVSDIDSERARSLAERIGAEVVPPENALGVECDVYAPCALGGTLNASTIPQLRCRVVAGCANNQLAEPADASRLSDAGILYAPDYVINAGGVVYAWGSESLGWDADHIERRLAGIGDSLAEIYARADSEAITTEAAAERLARARL